MHIVLDILYGLAALLVLLTITGFWDLVFPYRSGEQKKDALQPHCED